MKETVKINLSGLLFDLDSDAYERLKSYLESIERKFANIGGSAEEILADIEQRIAEILQEKISGIKQVIALNDIEEIIALMGTADEMDDLEEDENSQAEEPSFKTQNKSSKRLFRDPQNRILGGVASGAAAYFNIDPLWIRLLFVIAFFASLVGAVVYLVLWFILPPAQTTAERLEMQGKSIHLDDIEESVRNEYERVKSTVKDIPNSKQYKNAENALSEMFTAIGKVFLVFFKVVGVIMAIAFFVVLIAALLSVFVGGAAFIPWQIDEWQLSNLFYWDFTLLGFCLFVVIAIPIIGLIVKIFRLLFDLPASNRIASGIAATVWFIAFISLIVLLGVETDRGIFRSTNTTTHTISTEQGTPLYMGIKTHSYNSNDFENYQVFNFKFAYDEYSDEFYKRPNLVITESATNTVKLKMQYSYADFKVGRVPDHIDNIVDYQWYLKDSLLVFNEFYICDDEDAWRVPYLTINIELPEGQVVYFDDDLQRLLNEDTHTGQFYEMVNGELKSAKMD